MIREKAIFIKLNQLQLSDKQLFDKASSDFNLSACVCPSCKAKGFFKEIQPYERFMISVRDTERTESVVSVARFRCESCGHTHAILPDILIPYGSYTLRFILTVLSDYLDRSCTVMDLCAHWGIAVSTLYDWIHLFTEQYNAWCHILDRVLWVCRHAVDDLSSFPSFPSAFFMRFAFSFLQGGKTSRTVSAPSRDRRRKPFCT